MKSLPNKKELRRIAKENFSRLSQEQKNKIQSQFFLHLKKIDFKPFQAIALFQALPDEISYTEFFMQSQFQDKTFVFPRVLSDSEMVMKKVSHPLNPAEWEKVGNYQIHEPKLELEAIDPEKIDLLFVPGLLFTKAGQRLGRGKGYYDRYLKKCIRAKKISLCFEGQMVDALPEEDWDVLLDEIITV